MSIEERTIVTAINEERWRSILARPRDVCPRCGADECFHPMHPADCAIEPAEWREFYSSPWPCFALYRAWAAVNADPSPRFRMNWPAGIARAMSRWTTPLACEHCLPLGGKHHPDCERPTREPHATLGV